MAVLPVACYSGGGLYIRIVETKVYQTTDEATEGQTVGGFPGTLDPSDNQSPDGGINLSKSGPRAELGKISRPLPHKGMTSLPWVRVSVRYYVEHSVEALNQGRHLR